MIENEAKKVVFKKEEQGDLWPSDCSDKELLKLCGRVEETIDHVQWEDGEFIASFLNIYFK